ncbi:unnamed protein product [Sphagnum balticum]
MDGNGVINFVTQSTTAQGINVTDYTFANSAAAGVATTGLCLLFYDQDIYGAQHSCAYAKRFSHNRFNESVRVTYRAMYIAVYGPSTSFGELSIGVKDSVTDGRTAVFYLDHAFVQVARVECECVDNEWRR